MPVWLPAVLVIISLLSLFFLNRKYKYSFTGIFGVCAHLLFFFLGAFSFYSYNKKPVFYGNGKFLATVLESPQEKENSYKSVLVINSFSRTGLNQFSEVHEKVLVYLEPDSMAAKLTPGDKVIFSQTPHEIRNNGNPFEFDYKKYMGRKKIYRQVYLPSGKWVKVNYKTPLSLIILAEKTRDKLLMKYRGQDLGENEQEILSALTLGYKRELDPEIKRVFSSAGAMHVLAVSGLHVGIIYWVLVTFLGIIKRGRAGRLSFAFISLLCLWAFAFITGLSPSVMRAATMFSFIVIGGSIKRNVNIYNSLAASAFLLLIINPNNLFEAGFQLSYSAVFGIVYLQPAISSIITVNNRVLKYFWALLTVSVSAQIVTFPISVFYFNQFPTYFFISNLFVIPAVAILIPLGILLLAFSSFPLFSGSISLLINSILSAVYLLLKKIESLPFAVLEISISTVGLIFIITFLSSVLLILETRRISYLKLALSSVFLLLCTSFIQEIHAINTNRLIVYNSSGDMLIQLISGKSNYVISGHKTNMGPYENNIIANTTAKLDLPPPLIFNHAETFKNKDLFLKNGIIYFKGKLIATKGNANKLQGNLTPDFIINPVCDPEKSFNPNTLVIITSKRYFPRNLPGADQIFDVSNQGGYQKIW